ncbi:MAG: nucleotidyltransferase domain-containing protein [Candidatus Woesearchaeota archaeon]
MIKDIKKILEEVLQEIKPDNKPIIITERFIEKINKTLKEKKILAKATLGGSMAKNTHLKGDFDADIFIKFDFKYKGCDISEILQLAITNYKYERVKGSRDYYHIHDEILFELVPVLDVKCIKDADNVIDMSPMHVKYFKENGAGLEDDVRLLKKFLKANRVYGAESYINGFSGHIVDLLVIKYKSFLNVLKATQKWNNKVIIDIDKKLKDPLMELDRAKTQGPLIIVDPMQENRNAAAALSHECFNTFVMRAKEFLKDPNKEFFIKKSAKELITQNKESGELFELTIKPQKNSKDIAGAKVLKALEHIIYELKNKDFKIKQFEWDFDSNAKAYILLDDEELQEKKFIQGPPLTSKKHCESFNAKHKETFEKKGFLCANIKRKYTKPEQLIKDLIKEKYIQERVKEIRYKMIN